MRPPRLTLLAGATAILSLAAAAPAMAAPVVRQATGANAASITAAVDAFETEVGANDCPADSGCRRVTWDGVPDERSDPAFMPAGQFRAANGGLFETPGLGVQTSADDNSADAGPFNDPDEIQYRAINATYDETFEPFTAQRLFTSIGSNVIDTEFAVPDTSTPADTNAFGVVFSDVDSPGSMRMQYFAPDGSSLGTFNAPATAGAETFSFLGVIFNAGERIARVRITQGNAALATGVNDVSQGGTADLVTTDNFVFGDPQEQAPPPAEEQDRTAPGLDIDAPGKAKVKKFLKGIKYSVAPGEESQIDVSLVSKAKKAEIAATGDLVLASDSFDFSTETREGKLKPNKKLVGKAKKIKAKLVVETIDRSGNKAEETDRIKVKK